MSEPGGRGARGGAPAAPSVVVAHDFMEAYGGAERITAEIAQAFPDAPVVAIMGRRSVARRMGVEDRFISLLPARERFLRHYRLAAPAFPLIVDRLRVPPADVVLSSSYAFAHRLRPWGGGRRVCYSYSPLRFAWTMAEDYREEWSGPPLTSLAFRAFAVAMRCSDRRSAQSVDRYLAPGRYVAGQIERFYGRDADIVGAPVDCEHFHPSDDPPGDYFLFCGRLIEPYKKVTMLVQAFNEVGERLVVVGDGPERERIQAIAEPNIEFTGELPSDRVVALMQRCRATIFPSQDDFGLIPVETMACGRPVLAYAGGGALETVRPGETGEFFPEQTPESLAGAMRSFRPEAYDPRRIREHALGWDRGRFRERLVAAVADAEA